MGRVSTNEYLVVLLEDPFKMNTPPLLEVVVGSTLHGTAVDNGLEDLDLLSIVVESLQEFVGFSPTDTWTERTKPEGVRSEAGDVDRAIYGLRHYLGLVLKGNPTMLLPLFAPRSFWKRYDARAEVLQSLAPDMVSKRSYEPFRRYMRQQHERLLGLRGQRNVTRPELVSKYGYDTKYAGHIVRLGYQGTELLRTGRLTLPMREHERQTVRDVRTGKYTLAEISELILEAEVGITEAYNKSPLPDAPNQKKIEEWMIAVYASQWRLDSSRDEPVFR
jgi:uncharacterized protein